MANTTQNQEKNAVSDNIINEEVQPSKESEDYQGRIENSVAVAESKDELEVQGEMDGHVEREAKIGEVERKEEDAERIVKKEMDIGEENNIEEVENVDGEEDEEEEDGDGYVEGDLEGDAEDAAGDAEQNAEEDAEGDTEGDVDGEEQFTESKTEKPLDHDQDRRNPQYIPKGGAFYEHDNRTSSEDVENKDPQDVEKKKKVWKESKESERWLHDWYKESEQEPKTKEEIIEIYGYDIRKEEAPPRVRRRRKYGRGPDKYDRNWKDEEAYLVKQNVSGRRGKKKTFGKDEFPPLPNRKNDVIVEKSSPKSPNWKKTEEEYNKKSQKVINHDKHSTSSQIPRNDYPAHRINVPGINLNRKSSGQNKRINEDEIKPFRQYDKTKWKNNFRRGKPEVIKPSKLKITRQIESQSPRRIESNNSYTADSDIAHLSEGFGQMTFHNKHLSMRDNRQDSNEIVEQELDSPGGKLNPKRYSKTRKGFTSFFPAEEILELDPAEMKQLQQEQQQKNQHLNLPQQPLNIQSVIRRYPGPYNGNSGYIASRPIITGITQQGMSPQGLQQALSPQGIPQQALSPQVPGLQPLEIQQGPIPAQPNFVPPMYMDPHYGPSDMMGPFTGYAPYSANQAGEMYQPPGGITYYNTECQNSNPVRLPPARRQKAAIPIVRPP